MCPAVYTTGAHAVLHCEARGDLRWLCVQIGCFESHRKAWKKVVDEELRQAIIMEDDADVDLSVHMKDVAAFVSDAPPDWQMLYLGINNDKVPCPAPASSFGFTDAGAQVLHSTAKCSTDMFLPPTVAIM